MAKQNKPTFKVRCYPILYDGKQSNQTYEVEVSDVKDIKDYPDKIWKY